MSTVGFVYFARMGDSVKIGWSKWPNERMRQIQTTAPGSVDLVGMFMGTREDERAMHRRFSHLRQHGEWFAADESLTRLIPCLCSERQQAEARMDKRSDIWFDIALDARDALFLASPEHDEEDGGFYAELRDAAQEMVRIAGRAWEQCRDRADQRVAAFGEGADACVRPPRRPTAGEIKGLQERRRVVREREKAKAAEIAARPQYLDARAIFDDEAPDGDPVGQA